MNNQTLVIYDFNIVYEILKEIESYLNFKLIHIDKNKIDKSIINNQENFLFISHSKIKQINSQLFIKNFPIEIIKLVESININFLKKKYNQQYEIFIGPYKLDLNSRSIFKQDISLSLTEREANIIIFLNNSNKPVKISKLQSEVWGHNSKLETHTVETHIYRLRKKINNVFNDKNFIKSSKTGYII